MALSNKDKYFTVLVLSDAESKVKKIRIHHSVLRFIFVIVGIILVAVVTLVSNAYITHNQLENKIVELERIKEKINYKEVEVANLQEKSNEITAKTKILESYLSQVENLDKMVRDITGKGGFQEQVALYSNDLNANVDLTNDPNEIFYYDFADSENLDNINAILDDLIAKVPDMSAKLTEDKQHMEDHIYMLDHTPSIWPTTGVISSIFGDKRGSATHGGLDIATNVGTPVKAAASGVIIFAGRNQGFGNEIIIHHGFGITTIYGHLNKINVTVGQEVIKGEIIAQSGNTGYSTGPHLHYEIILNDGQVNPMNYLP
jgi:murein DD-endopeptidase MepM/ murein hydrolase activator NlpD